MIQLDAPDPLRTPSLSIAARTGNVDVVHKLLKEGRRTDNVDNRGWTPLHEAASAGHVACAALLLSQDEHIKDLRTFEGETPLFLSVNDKSETDVMKVLLNHSADVNLGNNEQFTPLHKACELDSLACAQLLLEFGADVNAADADGNRPIHEAITKRSVELVNLLLKHGADLTVKNSNGLTPLMGAAFIGFYQVIKKLDKPELHLVNERKVTGRTALMMAAQGGHIKTTKLLLEMGADANIVSDDIQQTALHLAAHGEDPRLVRVLVEVTDVEKVAHCTNISPIILAVDSMKVESVKLLLEWMNGHPNLMRKPIACQSEALRQMYRMMGAVSYLLYHKADLEDALPVLQLLLKNGFPANACSKFEVPPLVAITAALAPKGVKKKCIQVLLDHGADADCPCPWHHLSSLPVALYYACHLHPHEKWLIRLLMSASRKCDPDTLLSVVHNADLDGGERHPSKSTLQQMLNIALELGFTDCLTMSRIWRKFRSSGLIGEGLQNLQEDSFENYLDVPEVLTPPSLSKLCRIVIHRHYCLSDLKKRSLPSVVIDFLNYVF